MDLDQALEITYDALRRGFRSDGCTFAPELGIRRFCQMHDVLIAHNLVTRREADDLFYKGIMTKGKRYFPIAVIYWLAVRFHAVLTRDH